MNNKYDFTIIIPAFNEEELFDVPYYNDIVLHKKSKLNSIRLNADSFFYQAEALLKLNKNQNSFIVKPTDEDTILKSVSKTNRVIIADNGWAKFGVTAEIISIITENIFHKFESPPARIAMNDSPSPSTRALANNYYPRARN